MFKEIAPRAVPQRADSEETRRQILETALALFREHGFEETTIRDIAASAGLSLGAADYYFRSKESSVGAYYGCIQEEHQAARGRRSRAPAISASDCARRSTPRSTSSRTIASCCARSSGTAANPTIR
jgi:AcrR family transcriptional regulator